MFYFLYTFLGNLDLANVKLESQRTVTLFPCIYKLPLIPVFQGTIY